MKKTIQSLFLLMLSFSKLSNAQIIPISSTPKVLKFDPTTHAPTFKMPTGVTTYGSHPSFLASPPTATIAVNYIGPWTPAAITAMEYAKSILETKIISSVTINVDASWGSVTWPALGSASPNTGHIIGYSTCISSPYTSVFCQAEANMLTGADLDPSSPDIISYFSDDSSWPLGLSWYYGTSGAPSSSQIDFVTVALHELTHGIGFLSLTGADNYGISVGAPFGCVPYAYDNRIKLTAAGGATSMLTSYTGCTPSATLLTLLSNSNVKFNSSCGATDYPLYSPNPYVPGSSISHLNETSYPIGDPNSLMTPFLSAGEAIHDLGPVGYCILKDICWEVNYVLGIEDNINITTCPSTLSLGTTPYTCSASFEDADPIGPTKFNFTGNCWKLIMPTKNAGDYIHKQGNGSPSGLQFYNNWTFTMGALPTGKVWTRNIDGTVRAYIEIKGYDSDGVLHTERKPVKVNVIPDKPLLTVSPVAGVCNAAKMSFYSSGATSYKLYWGSTYGAPYASSYTFTNDQTIYTVTGLTNGIKYFNVKGVNTTGLSAYADQKSLNIYCSKYPIDYKITQNTNELDNLSFSIYPNPASNYLCLNGINTEKQNIIFCTDVNGRKIDLSLINSNSNELTFDISNLSNGIYLLSVINENAELKTLKFIKNE